ncbi:MAG: phage terminase large subunit, partial [Salibacteraceae bacterium]
RGGAKSFTLALIALRYAEQYKERARILYIRQTYKGLSDFEQITMDLFGQLYGKKASYNATEHVWRLPNGAYFELGQLESPRDYTKYQGRSFGLLLCDEITQYSTPTMLDKLRSNLRAPMDIPIRVVAAANPGGAGHQWVAQRYVFKNAGTWKPFEEAKSEKQWVYAPSTFLDNPFIDQEQYKKQLAASCPSDPELLRAWLAGDWSVARGAFFGSVLEESRNAIEPWKEIPARFADFGDSSKSKWDHFLSHDYGSSAPSVTYVMVKSPGEEINGVFYPKDSIIIVDELATNELDDISSGMGYTVPVLSERIKEMCDKWNIQPKGCADDACFAQHGHGAGSIADEFKQQGVYFRRARKADRKTGWERMRTMLQDAG